MKGHWLVSGVIGVVIGVYFLGQGEKRSQFAADSASGEPSGTGPYSPTKEDLAETTHSVAEKGAHAVNASARAVARVTHHRAAERTRFLDPDVKYIGITQTDVNRTPIDVGKHLDANATPPALPDVGVSGSQQTPINIGEYLDPNPMSRGLLPVYASRASGDTRSDIGPYLDPNAVVPEASSVEPPGQRNVGSRLEVDP